ncbi:MAG: hypothetical protein Q9183_005928, partial [Haloplaca sp. 2 TL-2023]
LLLVATLTLPESIESKPRYGVPALSLQGVGTPYHHYKCKFGPPAQKDVAISCLRVLTQMQRERREPRIFVSERWHDPSGCEVSVTLAVPGSTIYVQDIPDDLIFLLYRCFLPDQVEASKSASILHSDGLGYKVEIWPPHDTTDALDPQSASVVETALPSDVSDSASTSVARRRLDLDSRSRVHCASRLLRPTGAYTDCLHTMLNILEEPGSGIPMSWEASDGRDWHAPNCVIKIQMLARTRRGGRPDVFTERSLIEEALWIMGRCFAGPEASQGYDSGKIAVGRFKKWGLSLEWGDGVSKVSRPRVNGSSIAAKYDRLSPG